MPNDRSLLGQLRENLTTKKLLRFFPDPDAPAAVGGNELRLTEMLDSALWWLGKKQPIELVDNSTYTMPATGRLDLGPERTSRVRKVLTVEQNGEFYEQARTDWSEGEPVLCGSWMMYRHQLFALGLYSGRLPMAPRSRGSSPSVHVERQLYEGAITLYFYGIPLEADIIDVHHYRQAVVDYALHLAINSILTQALRDKRIKMEGIPEIFVNVEDLQKASKLHLKAAEMVLDQTYVTTA